MWRGEFMVSPPITSAMNQRVNGNFGFCFAEVGDKPGKQVTIGNDNGNCLFFRNEGMPEVYRWDTQTPFNETNFKMVYRSPPCQLATHALADFNRGRMMVLDSNFPDYLQNLVSCGAIQQLTLMQGAF